MFAVRLSWIISSERNNPSRNSVKPAMARYFFHFHDGTDQPDHTGTELASSKAARDAAVVFMGEKLKELDGAASWTRAARLSARSGSLVISWTADPAGDGLQR